MTNESAKLDIEDMLKTLAFLHGKKWTTMMVSRVYFGNWLRDYSQAIDVGSVKGVNAATIRILVRPIFSFLGGRGTYALALADNFLRAGYTGLGPLVHGPRICDRGV